MPAKARTALLMLSASAMLAGCGVRGPVQMPKADASSPPATGASAEAGQGKPENAAAKPHQGFILDGLLR